VSLCGRELRTIKGQPNRIVRIDGTDVIVATTRSPEGKPVPIRWVQDAMDRLMASGEIEISVDSVGYRSAFVGAVLLALDGSEVVVGATPPRIRLRSRG
jgi:hypothetical protein